MHMFLYMQDWGCTLSWRDVSLKHVVGAFSNKLGFCVQ